MASSAAARPGPPALTIHVPLDPMADGINVSPWLLRARGDRSVLKFFDPMGGLTPRRGDEDHFDNDSLQPLLPDRAMEGRSISLSGAGSKLLAVPVEILANILGHIADDKKALRSLALVNSDCRQLARSCQFSTVRFDYSHYACRLLGHLAEEAQSRDRQSRVGHRGTIGACIRRIEVETDIHCIEDRHKLHIYRREFKLLPINEQLREFRRQTGPTSMCTSPSLHSSCAALPLPHLEYLDWGDPILLEKSFFNSLVRSSVKVLSLYHVSVAGDFEVEAPPSGVWPLRSLRMALKLLPNDQPLEGRDPHEFFRLPTSILRLCAPTLEALRWEHEPAMLKPIPSDPGLMEFPRLRKLHLGSTMTLEKPLAKALLGSRLSG